VERTGIERVTSRLQIPVQAFAPVRSSLQPETFRFEQFAATAPERALAADIADTHERPNRCASTLPTASGVNPMVTIEAIAHMNASALAERVS
jgi:hypothetical protein